MLWAKTPKSGNQDNLMLTPTNIEDPPSQCAVCAVVGTVSANHIFLEAHRNYNLNIERTSLETLKAQFQIVSPDNHPEFDANFNQAIAHIRPSKRRPSMTAHMENISSSQKGLEIFLATL